jgi:energy-coupling factor transport system permease protein
VSLLALPVIGDSWLARRDATAKLIAAALPTVALLVTLNPATTLAAIGLELAVTPLAGLSPRTLARRGWPLLISAAGVFVSVSLFAADDGTRFSSALSLALRLVAVALPGMLAFTTIDPTDLADSLIAHLKVPPRFAIGALAAFRLMPLLSAEWRQLRLARRARGIDAGWNPVTHAKLFASTTFALLVGAIRRGIRLATAMEARGFDGDNTRRQRRTTARKTHFDGRDVAVIGGGVVIATVALAAGQLFAGR